MVCCIFSTILRAYRTHTGANQMLTMIVCTTVLHLNNIQRADVPAVWVSFLSTINRMAPTVFSIQRAHTAAAVLFYSPTPRRCHQPPHSKPSSFITSQWTAQLQHVRLIPQAATHWRRADETNSGERAMGGCTWSLWSLIPLEVLS